jgi:hypothetical protein
MGHSQQVRVPLYTTISCPEPQDKRIFVAIGARDRHFCFFENILNPRIRTRIRCESEIFHKNKSSQIIF